MVRTDDNNEELWLHAEPTESETSSGLIKLLVLNLFAYPVLEAMLSFKILSVEPIISDPLLSAPALRKPLEKLVLALSTGPLLTPNTAPVLDWETGVEGSPEEKAEVGQLVEKFLDEDVLERVGSRGMRFTLKGERKLQVALHVGNAEPALQTPSPDGLASASISTWQLLTHLLRSGWEASTQKVKSLSPYNASQQKIFYFDAAKLTVNHSYLQALALYPQHQRDVPHRGAAAMYDAIISGRDPGSLPEKRRRQRRRHLFNITGNEQSIVRISSVDAPDRWEAFPLIKAGCFSPGSGSAWSRSQGDVVLSKKVE